MDDQRVVLGPVLGHEDTLRSNRVEGVGSQAIDSLGGHTNNLTLSEDLSSLFEDEAGV